MVASLLISLFIKDIHTIRQLGLIIGDNKCSQKEKNDVFLDSTA